MFTWFRHKAMDRELTEILDTHQRVKADAAMVRDYLLQVIEDDRNGIEKFSDAALLRAQEIIDEVGPGAFYWMTDIAAQMTMLATAQLNGFPTNVSQELGDSATPEQVIDTVVKI